MPGLCQDSASVNIQYADEILGEISLNVSQITVMKKKKKKWSGGGGEEDDDEEEEDVQSAKKTDMGTKKNVIFQKQFVSTIWW